MIVAGVLEVGGVATSTCFERECCYISVLLRRLADYDEELKCLPKFGGLVRISATRCRKICGAEFLEEIW